MSSCECIRVQIGIVSQEPTLFGTSIKANIAYGKAGATDAEIEAAAAAANAHNFISALPNG
jgi:ABC-type multidrug transport system fused ATPase/permease subunit